MTKPAAMTGQRLRPLAEWTDAGSGLRGVFTDIDDTLTLSGRVPGRVIQAMERLRQSGLLVIPVTGRPAGWCDMIARTWPVDAVVGENGALAYRYDGAARRMTRLYADGPEQRELNRKRLAELAPAILAAVPGAAIAADQAFRETDLAVDFAEDTGPLPDSDIQRIVDLFEAAGAVAKVSSIHVNGWFGSYDKLAMTRRLMAEVFDCPVQQLKSGFTFAGDSPNDAPMFGFFDQSVGVANLRPFASRCDALPVWITDGEGGDGFVELAVHLLAVR
ncbi:MAG: HAD-IIB family hydrolase [Rhodospirillales bacterium]